MLVVTPEQQVFLDSLDDKTRRIYEQAPEKDKRSILAMIAQVTESKLEVLAEPWKVDYENEPVPIEKWLESEYYLGKTVAKDLRDFWKQEIAQVINKRCIEWIITGSIGGGKTYAAIQLLLYKIHEIMCLRDPTAYYNAQSIVFGFFSILMNLVQSVEYQMFKTFVSESPYWCDIVNLDIQEGNSYKVQRAVFNFPKKVRFAFGSRAVHSLGQDLYAGLMDEVAFSNSLEAKQIVDLYANVRRRLDSRYLNTETGSLPGVLCVVSSANYDGDWLDTHIRKSKDKRGTHTSSAALYVAKGPFKGDTFRVLVGDKLHQSKIIDHDVDLDALTCKPSDEQIPPDARIENVPVALYERYIEDLEGSLKDISGIALFSTSPLIPQRERVRACVDTSREHPFTVVEPSVDIFDNEMTLESVFEPDKLFEQVDAYRKVYTPRVNPGAPRFVGVDLALKHDGVGLAVCHTSGLKEVRRFDSEGNRFTEYAPIVYYDLLLRVKPPKGSEIDISKIRSFIFMLREMGMPIAFVSADTYQSSDFLQICAKQGLEVKQISVDRPPCDPYLALKEAILDGRVSYYQYEPFLNEIMTLQRDWEKKKVDHPPNGSKDCSDAAAQAYWSCSHSKYTMDRLNDASMLLSEKPQDLPSKPDDVRNFKQSSWAIGGDYTDADRITSYDADGGGYF